MSHQLIWLHEAALSRSHPAFKQAPVSCPAVYIWDEQRLQKSLYSMKKLVFLYETLCEMDIDIVKADSESFLVQHDASELFVPRSLDPEIINIIEKVRQHKSVHVVREETFCSPKKKTNTTRFFQYWKLVEKQLLG